MSDVKEEKEVMDNDADFVAASDLSSKFSKGQQVFLGFQHTLAMFGACILVPLLTGLSVSATLFAVGAGTLIFHFMTDRKVPAFLGSSFAFIGPLIIAGEQVGLRAAQGGIILAGITYIIVGYLMELAGPEKVKRVFPPVVTGPIIMIIGLSLAPVGIDMASGHWGVALITLGTAVIVNIWGKGMIKVLPIVIGLAAGYLGSLAFGLIETAEVAEASMVGLPGFTLPEFNSTALLLVGPAAIVSIVEHFGDVLAIGSTIGKDIRKDPGIPRTFYGGGLATILSGFVGGPSLTTYGENVGVLALTRVYATFVVSMGAVWAIALAFIPKIEAAIHTIPTPVIGGISVLLYGMIAAVGVRTVVENRVNFTKSRNLIVASVILVLGVGGVGFEIGDIEFSALVIAAVSGVVLNLILPGGEVA